MEVIIWLELQKEERALPDSRVELLSWQEHHRRHHSTTPDIAIDTNTMSSAINPFPVLRTVAFRPRPAVIRRSNVVVGVTRRTFADSSKDLPKAEGDVGPNMQQAEHVSEEAAQMAKIQGGKGPDIEGQGTPVQDVSNFL